MRYGQILCLGLAASLTAPDVLAGNSYIPDSSGSVANPVGLFVSPDTSPALQAAFNSDEKTASITGSFRVRLWEASQSDALLSITAQTPIAQGDKYENTVTLDGLTKSTSLSVALTWFSGGFGEGSFVKLADDVNQKRCRALVRRAADGLAANEVGTMPTIGDKDPCFEFSISNALDARKALDKKHLVPGAAATSQLEADDEVETAMARESRVFHRALDPTPAATWVVSANGKVGYEDHDYYDPTTLDHVVSSKTPWQAGLSVGYIFPEGLVSIHGGFNYQQAFLDGGTGQTQTKCLPDLTCVNGFIGAPLFKHKELFSVDFRWLTKDFAGSGYPVGIAPKFTYDAAAAAEAVQFPIYLISGADKNLTGGIRYDWTSTTHISTVGIFVSSAFSI